MKIIISHKRIKRKLETPFALCCSMNDLDDLIKELQAQRAAMKDATYGWIRVDPSHPCDCDTNTEPLAWTDAGNVNKRI